MDRLRRKLGLLSRLLSEVSCVKLCGCKCGLDNWPKGLTTAMRRVGEALVGIGDSPRHYFVENQGWHAHFSCSCAGQGMRLCNVMDCIRFLFLFTAPSTYTCECRLAALLSCLQSLFIQHARNTRDPTSGVLQNAIVLCEFGHVDSVRQQYLWQDDRRKGCYCPGIIPLNSTFKKCSVYLLGAACKGCSGLDAYVYLWKSQW